MTATNRYESLLWKLLEKGNLADLSQFHRPEVYDEVPLYSRLADVSFLSGDTAEKNEALICFSLKFLTSVISYEEHRSPYFAAITIWQSDDGPIVPNVFIWNQLVPQLYEKLELSEVKTKFGKSINKLLSRITLPGPLEVAEDTTTVPEMSRVFIGPSIPPYKSFVPIHAFHRVMAKQ